MTLVYRSSKDNHQKSDNQLGPGVYNIDVKHQTNNKKTYTFQSTTQRDAYGTKKYELQMKKIQELKKQQKQNKKISPPIEQQQQQKTVQIFKDITKPKRTIDCSHIFNSKVNRFQFSKEQRHNVRQDAIREKRILAQQFKKLLNYQKDKQNCNKLKIQQLSHKKKTFQQQSQYFPSIPNWENSYGYRLDTKTNKMVSNQNPNFIFQPQLMQKDDKKTKCALGPGYYVLKQKDEKKGSLWKKSSSSEPQSLNCPPALNSRSSNQIRNSIEYNQKQIKLRQKVLGITHAKRALDVIQPSQLNTLTLKQCDLQSNDKKSILLKNQMLKKFSQFIPKTQAKSPFAYLQKLEDIQRQKIDNKLTITENQIDHLKNEGFQHFLSKSQRFDSQMPPIKSQVNDNENIESTKTSAINSNDCSMFLNSFNKKQQYSLGQNRFSQSLKPKNLGPGSYQQSSVHSNKSPCLKLTEQRFHQLNNQALIPGPGQYDVTGKLLKQTKVIQQVYTRENQFNADQFRSTMRKEDSMESLYMNWGRQMNVIAKKAKNQVLSLNNNTNQKKQVNMNSKGNSCHDTSLLKVKKQLTQAVRTFKMCSIKDKTPLQCLKLYNNNNDKKSQNNIESNKKYTKTHPKITRHLYEYKQQRKNKKDGTVPSFYDTASLMGKKAFNVTYT